MFFLYLLLILSPENGRTNRGFCIREILFWRCSASFAGGMRVRCAWDTTHFFNARCEFVTRSTATPASTHAYLTIFLANGFSGNFGNRTPIGERILRFLLLVTTFLRIATHRSARFFYVFNDGGGGIAVRSSIIRTN